MAKDRRSILALGILLALALMLSAFAHRAVNTPAGYDASAYSLPDGSLQALCLPGTDEDGNSRQTGCEFCRLASSVDLPTAPLVPLANMGVSAGSLQIEISISLPIAALPAAPVRGPPLVA